MPYIQIEASPMSKEKKVELIKGLTEVASSILNISQSAFTVVIRENNPDNVGVGGIPLSERLKK